jgi:serine/threonine protein kinase
MMKNGVCKIGDFGLAKRYRNKRIKNDTSVGTPLYMSLQLLCSEKYTSKCDIWAIGCVFYEMLHGKTPWSSNARINLVN